MTNAQAAVKNQVILRRRNTGVAFLIMDAPGKHNLLTGEVMSEFDHTLDVAAADSTIKAVVIISGKPDTFVSGADLHEIIKFTDETQSLDLSSRGQAIFNKMANFPKPIVAAINGACLGGGLELVLCCDKRIATSAEITQLGLPEVRLGLIPGLGGTQRLPRLIGVRSAVELILSAETVSAEKALELGILDDVVNPDELLGRSESLAFELAQSGNRCSAERREPDMSPERLKQFLAMAERSVRIKTKGKYPAQMRVLEVIRHGLAEGLREGLRLESKVFAELSVSEVARNLIFLFFTTQQARLGALAASRKSSLPRVKTVGIVGGGLMGTSIAHLAINHGFKVILKTVTAERAYLAAQRVNELIGHADDAATKRENFVCAEQYNQLGEADLILETASEDEPTKIAVLRQIEAAAHAGTIIATNTSSLSVSKLANTLEDASRLLGLHFFHPVEKMPLVELIGHSGSSREAAARAAGFICQLEKSPVTVKDSACFLINRLLFCYLSEAARLAMEQTPLNWVDAAAIDFGMPIGPLALLDEVGLDVANMVAQSLYNAFGERMRPPDILKQGVDLGLIGKKAGRGIYRWDEHGKLLGFDERLLELAVIITDSRPDPETSAKLAERMILPMVDEAARCIEEKIVRRGREVDLCTVLGIGFPPFRGGLLRYADSSGIEPVVKKLEQIYQMNSSQRTVSEYLRKLAQQGRGFHTRSLAED